MRERRNQRSDRYPRVFGDRRVWYALGLRQAGNNATLVGGNLIAAAFFMLLGLWLISVLLVYPRINASTIPPIVVVGAPMALCFGWVGARSGTWMGALLAIPASVDVVDRRVVWIGAGSLAMLATLTVIYILMAAPPGV